MENIDKKSSSPQNKINLQGFQKVNLYFPKEDDKKKSFNKKENIDESSVMKRILRKRKQNMVAQHEEFIQHDVSLLRNNTLKIDARAKDYCVVRRDKDFVTLYELYKSKDFKQNPKKIFVLGEGSNTIFASREIESLVVKIDSAYFNIITQDDEFVWVSCDAGLLFRDFVVWSCENGFSGLENLAGIYGTVGAAPVQNIGAYGTEVKDVIDNVTYFDLKIGDFRTINNKDCNFSYRSSIFKYQDGTKIISQVCFKLKKQFVFNDSYSALSKAFANVKKSDINPLSVAKKVMEIRDNKLPNPRNLGNCGSFFKNPVISFEHYERLSLIYPNIVAYDDNDGKKISAAWLIEVCGFKGKKYNKVGMYNKQPLVLVNYGVRTVTELLDFADLVAQTVKTKFDIDLIKEPHIVY